ncbi:MAG: Ldh family oxidoreductase [Pseudomonadota bacterium]
MTTEAVSLAEAKALVARILAAHDVAPANAAHVAEALVSAEADGRAGHGFSRVAAYAAQARAGKVRGHVEPALTVDGAVARIDAGHGFAYPAIAAALGALPDLARGHGIALAAIDRSHHCGVLGHAVERLARQGLAALMFANAPASIAPWGGSTPLFGTNPIAFGISLDGADPVVIDLSVSRVARGNIMRAAQAGTPIPEGWALDADGRPTTDAEAALQGTMLPMGDAKGVALALMVEVLSAGLTGANYSWQASSFFDAEGAPPGVGQVIIAIDPRTSGGSAAHLAALAQAYEADEGARLPGSKRFESRARAERDGLVVPEAIRALDGA